MTRNNRVGINKIETTRTVYGIKQRVGTLKRLTILANLHKKERTPKLTKFKG